MKMTPRGRAERNWVLTGLALAAAAGLAIVSWQALNLNHRAETAAEVLADAQHTIEGLRSELEGVKATAARQAELVRLLAEPNSGLITLAALAPAPGAPARVLWDPPPRGRVTSGSTSPAGSPGQGLPALGAGGPDADERRGSSPWAPTAPRSCRSTRWPCRPSRSARAAITLEPAGGAAARPPGATPSDGERDGVESGAFASSLFELPFRPT